LCGRGVARGVRASLGFAQRYKKLVIFVAATGAIVGITYAGYSAGIPQVVNTVDAAATAVTSYAQTAVDTLCRETPVIAARLWEFVQKSVSHVAADLKGKSFDFLQYLLRHRGYQIIKVTEPGCLRVLADSTVEAIRCPPQKFFFPFW